MTNRKVSFNYYNLLKLSVRKKPELNNISNLQTSIKAEFSKLFIKNNGKLYSCLIPQFFKKFTVKNKKSKHGATQ